MKFLAIETSTRQLGVALIDEERLVASYELLAHYPHAAELPAAVNRVLQTAAANWKDLEALVVDIGPGSFTGLRIGLAFVKAIAFATGKPVVGVSSLDVLAAGLPWAALPVCALLDARQQNLYAALYAVKDGEAVRQSEYLLAPADEALELLSRPTIVVGDGCAAYHDRLLAKCPGAHIAPQELWLPKAATLARLGRARWLSGLRDDPALLVPMYLYPLDCSVRGPNRPSAVLSSRAASH